MKLGKLREQGPHTDFGEVYSRWGTAAARGYRDGFKASGGTVLPRAPTGAAWLPAPTAPGSGDAGASSGGGSGLGAKPGRRATPGEPASGDSRSCACESRNDIMPEAESMRRRRRPPGGGDAASSIPALALV